jgi:hypothetical protein
MLTASFYTWLLTLPHSPFMIVTVPITGGWGGAVSAQFHWHTPPTKLAVEVRNKVTVLQVTDLERACNEWLEDAVRFM